MDFWEPVESSANAYKLLLKAVTMIPKSHYMLGCLFILIVFFYNFLECHFIEDLFSGFRGSQVGLTYNPSSDIYQGVANKCRILHGSYLATPWLSSPHFQTTFLCFLARPPVVNYTRQLFHASDGGTVALDWLMGSDVLGDAHNAISKNDTTPIVVVIPGLTSDSADAYIKHLASTMAKHGWNVVVSNHRGLGGISVTSDCFYNAGWTEDIREIVEYLHREYPKAPLFAIGTSIGANVLVKYLGEDGDNVPVAGAAAICSPWDLLIGDRFIGRRLIQKLYDRALAIGLQGYAKQHEPRYSRLADWEGIKKSRSIRDFDNYATCLVGKFETVDTYYRRCSSSSYVQNVSVPLLCISALDDPLCTVEAIPWDECRANKNIVLATTKHGGHLALFEGVAASGLWWVRATKEFLSVLHASPFMHRRKKTQSPKLHSSVESLIDEGPYISVADGMVSAVGNELTTKDKDEVQHSSQVQVPQPRQIHDISTDEQAAIPSLEDFKPPDLASQLRRGLHQLSRQNRSSMWLLAYISIISTWPLLGKAIHFFFNKKPRNIKPAK